MPLRKRKRYLALKVLSETPPRAKDVKRTIWNAVLQLFGEYGASQTNLALIEYDSEKFQAILRCSHEALDMVKTSIASVTDMNEKSAAIHVLDVSGTLKTLRKRISVRN